MKKLADLALLPFYCQNTLVALLLINLKLAWSYVFKLRITCINKRFYNFQIKHKLCNAACYVPSFIRTSKINYLAKITLTVVYYVMIFSVSRHVKQRKQRSRTIRTNSCRHDASEERTVPSEERNVAYRNVPCTQNAIRSQEIAGRVASCDSATLRRRHSVSRNAQSCFENGHAGLPTKNSTNCRTGLNFVYEVSSSNIFL
jgi:hypothetical protein